MTAPDPDGALLRPVIRERAAIRLQDASGRPEAFGLPVGHPQTYSLLVVPIASPNGVHGCLALRNKLGSDGFNERDEEIAGMLATHAGIAYKNAQLYENLRLRSAAFEQQVIERSRAEMRTQLALTVARIGIWELL